MGVGFKIQDPKKASQGALTISPNLAQSSALVEAKRFQIAIDNLVNMNSTNSHYYTKTLHKLYSSKKINK